MIGIMRRYPRTLHIVLLVVIAAFVLSSVIYLGATSIGGGAPANAVASVNGEPIPIDRFERTYRQYVDMFQQASRQPLTSELAEQLGLRNQVIEGLVLEAIVVQRARAEGLEASDEDVNAYVHAMPVFQEAGEFSLKRYQAILAANNLTDAAFVKDVRRQLTRARMRALIADGVKVSDGEVEQEYARRNEQVRAEWALVDLAPLASATAATDAELESYLKEHGGDFRLPERRRVQSVTFEAKRFTPNISSADVEKYYAEHGKEFEAPRQVRAAHILARVPESGGSAAEDKARAKIADAIRRAKAGEDFGKLAKELSEDPGSANAGGDLGYVRAGEMVPDFERAMMALKKGEISSEPVRTQFGFHAIRVIDVKEAEKKPLKDVAAQIHERLATEGADKAAKAKAEETRATLAKAPDFMAEAKRLGLTPVESVIPRTERRLNPAGGDPMEEAAFNLAAGGVSAPVKTMAGWTVLKTAEALPAAVPPLAEIHDKVAGAVRRQKAEAAAFEKAKQIVADAKGGDFAAAARKAGATTGETPPFSRTKPAEKLPGDAMLAALSSPAGTVTAPVKSQQGVYVLKVVERKPADMTGLATERDKLAREMLTQKQSQAWEAWVSGARSSAKIEMGAPLRSSRRS